MLFIELIIHRTLHTGHLRGHLRNTPDWVRRSIRLSICLVTFGLLGHTVHYPGFWAAEVSKSFNWAAITCIVVTAPLIGKASETANYRVVGTISGGLWGFLMWWMGAALFGYQGGATFVALVSPVLVVGTTYLAYKRGMDQLAKYMQITYVICGYGTFVTAQDAITLTMIRVSGIISGAVLSLFLAVVVLPRSASVETCREIKKSLKLIVDLNHEIWKLSSSPVPKVFKDRRGHHHESTLKMARGYSSTGQLDNNGKKEEGGGPTGGPNANEATAEKIFITSALTLSKVDDMIEATKAEIYIHHLWGSYFFFPGLLAFPLGSWHLPEKKVSLLVCSIRRIFRLQWALLLNMEDGMDENLQGVLKSSYPKGIMAELADAMHKSLLDLHAAFPDGANLCVDNLLNLGSVIDALIDITDAKHRDAVGVKREMRERRTQAGGRVSLETQRKGEDEGKAKGSDEVVIEVQDDEKAKLISSNGRSDVAPLESKGSAAFKRRSLKLETVMSADLQEIKGASPVIFSPNETYEPLTVQFPNTSKGFASMVQWHSFQFILDELVEELEEAFVACSEVIASLPHPIK